MNISCPPELVGVEVRVEVKGDSVWEMMKQAQDLCADLLRLRNIHRDFWNAYVSVELGVITPNIRVGGEVTRWQATATVSRKSS